MKQLITIIIASTLVLSSCGSKQEDPSVAIAKLKKERADIDIKISELEAKSGKKDTLKSISVSVTELQPQSFQSFIDVQTSITGDQTVLATPQTPGVIKSILVHVGQHVSKGQVMVITDATTQDQQLAGEDVQVSLLKSLYEKQQKLWAQNIGTEVSLLTAKAAYEGELKKRAALAATKNMYRIVAPISGTVDQMNLKEGDMINPGKDGILVVNDSKLKAVANLGEIYLGKVHTGNPVTIVFPDANDSINTRISFVSESVDPVSRAFNVQVQLGSNKKLHPNMSARMKIANYASENALLVPVAAIQKTSAGDIVFVANGSVAKSVPIVSGRNENGMVEILKGLKAGDKVITAGFEDLDNGTAIKVQ